MKAITVENLSKRYRIGLKEAYHDSLSSLITSFVKYPLQNLKNLRKLSRFDDDDPDIFWALRDIEFEVEQGEVLGIIGKNGAGKSTLLKLLSRITEPTTGRIKIVGRVASLLEVGTGFHPEMTGRENVYLNGTVLGMSKKEVDKKFDEIVDFSGVDKFVDTPVKRYSSGMKVRLGFAVAAHLDPEVLIVDEVLAVGDYEFQKKCIGRMNKVASEGRTVLFVSHNMGAVADLCTSCMLLQQGKIFSTGKTLDVINDYLNVGDNRSNTFPPEPEKKAYLNSYHLQNSNGVAKEEFDLSEEINIELEYTLTEDSDELTVAFYMVRGYENVFTTFDCDSQEKLIKRKKGVYRSVIKIPPGFLKGGLYYGSIGLRTAISLETIRNYENIIKFRITDTTTNTNLKGYAEKRAGTVIFNGTWENEQVR